MFSSKDEVEMVNKECRAAGIGCVDCKKKMAKNLNAYFAPLRERRAEFEKRPDDVHDILEDGAARARVIARQTMHEVYEAIGMP